MQELFRIAIKDASDTLLIQAKYLVNLSRIAPLFGDLDLSDCASFYVGDDSDHFYVHLYLKEDRKNSHLPHQLAQHFQIKMTKSKDWNEASLNYWGETTLPTGGRLAITVLGAVPDTCKLVPEEIPIPESEIQRTRIKWKIECPQAAGEGDEQ